ncbi:hypothetical protein [Streptomyces sp. NPDC094032]|uniref:hypothetical protein n=1 Tax=Streptomyces sp. NPDC094032 TaxID=3155308 RepID=UPI00331F2095
MALAIGLLYWYVRLPEVVLVVAPVLAGIVVWGEVRSSGGAVLVANLGVLAALGLGWAAAWARLRGRRKQRLVLERVAGSGYRRWEPAGRLWRGAVLIGTGLVLVALAVGAVVVGLRAVAEDERAAALATRTEALVTGRTDLSLRVRAEDGRRLTVDALFPEDYRVGSTVTVLEDESGARLAAEPYDAFGEQLATLAAGLPGVSLLTAGLLARRRAAALRSRPVPALRVLERMDEEGRTWVYPADDTAERMPLFMCACAAEEPPGLEGPWESGEPGEFGDVRHDGSFLAVRLREAVMLGVPYEGGELALLAEEFDGQPVAIRTVAPVRAVRTPVAPGR